MYSCVETRDYSLTWRMTFSRMNEMRELKSALIEQSRGRKRCPGFGRCAKASLASTWGEESAAGIASSTLRSSLTALFGCSQFIRKNVAREYSYTSLRQIRKEMRRLPKSKRNIGLEILQGLRRTQNTGIIWPRDDGPKCSKYSRKDWLVSGKIRSTSGSVQCLSTLQDWEQGQSSPLRSCKNPAHDC